MRILEFLIKQPDGTDKENNRQHREDVYGFHNSSLIFVYGKKLNLKKVQFGSRNFKNQTFEVKRL